MSIFHPETAEDKMAIVPLIGCGVPILIALVIGFVVSPWAGLGMIVFLAALALVCFLASRAQD